MTDVVAKCPSCGGDAGDNWFDRTLCGPPCESMHTRCSNCGAALDPCPAEPGPHSSNRVDCPACKHALSAQRIGWSGFVRCELCGHQWRHFADEVGVGRAIPKSAARGDHPDSDAIADRVRYLWLRLVCLVRTHEDYECGWHTRCARCGKEGYWPEGTGKRV